MMLLMIIMIMVHGDCSCCCFCCCCCSCSCRRRGCSVRSLWVSLEVQLGSTRDKSSETPPSPKWEILMPPLLPGPAIPGAARAQCAGPGVEICLQPQDLKNGVWGSGKYAARGFRSLADALAILAQCCCHCKFDLHGGNRLYQPLQQVYPGPKPYTKLPDR